MDWVIRKQFLVRVCNFHWLLKVMHLTMDLVYDFPCDLGGIVGGYRADDSNIEYLTLFQRSSCDCHSIVNIVEGSHEPHF